MKLAYLLIALSLLFSRCTSSVEDLIYSQLVDVNQFKMDQKALNNSDSIKVIGCSNALQRSYDEREIDFYNLIVVERISDGKRVNVFMPFPIEIQANNQYSRFLSIRTDNGKLIANHFNNSGMLKKGGMVHFKKVFVDLKYFPTKEIFKYPTIIGYVGLKIRGDLEVLN